MRDITNSLRIALDRLTKRQHVTAHANIFDVMSGSATPDDLDDGGRKLLEELVGMPDVDDAIEDRITDALAGVPPVYGLRELPDPDLTINNERSE